MSMNHSIRMLSMLLNENFTLLNAELIDNLQRKKKGSFLKGHTIYILF
jgi:hypothetical protein